VDAILVQYPLSQMLTTDIKTIEDFIDPSKNVDATFAMFEDWQKLPRDYLVSDTKMRPIPSIIAHEILQSLNYDITKGKTAIIGDDEINQPALQNYVKGCLGGKEMNAGLSALLCASSADKGLSSQDCKTVISCVNQPGVINLSQFPNCELFMDFGYGLSKNNLQGDLKISLMDKNNNAWVTPVPGGAGMLIGAALLRNLYVAWKFKHGLK
jgi:5,10-methylene-tetrahydrofolate dehydrogenase/methenyl tetrahydrofolate cyclohydrolase